MRNRILVSGVVGQALLLAACTSGGSDLLPAAPLSSAEAPAAAPEAPVAVGAGAAPSMAGGGEQPAPMAAVPAAGGEAVDGSGQRGEAEGVAESGGGLSWVAPAEWRATELASAMRIANWDAGPEGVEMSCALFAMPGGGSVDDNVRRWVGQFEGAGGGPPNDAEQASVDVAGRTVTLVRASGTYLDRGASMQAEAVRREGFGLFGAIVPMGEGTGFLKCTGPEITVQSQERTALAFVRTIRVVSP